MMGWRTVERGGATGRGRRRCAAVLLLVFLLGLGVTTLAGGWLFAAPYHDHLYVGVQHRNHGIRSGNEAAPHRHTHDGDELSRALGALRTVAAADDMTSVTAGGGVVPTWSPAAAPSDAGSLSFSLAVLLALAVLPRLSGRRTIAADAAVPVGCCLPPQFPPPRDA